MVSRKGERHAIVSGLGQSAVGRRLHRSDLDLTVEASLAAISDAGLVPDDIDGLAAFPGAMSISPGFSGPGTSEVRNALGLETNWHGAGLETPAQLGAVVNACMAVAFGLCRHVLVYRTVTEGSARHVQSGRNDASRGSSHRLTSFYQWLLPFQAFSAVQWIALYAQRHMHQYGTTREQLGWVAITTRAHASLNPKAIYQEPLSMEEYLAARSISTPFGLFDCDVPCDGSTAFVISDAAHGASCPKPPIKIEAVGTALRGPASWDQWPDLSTMAAHGAAAHMWSRTDLTPADVDVAELYDGFSFLTIAWLEALGFCAPGQGGSFVEGGERIRLKGQLPVNTDGGQLSAGRLHGFGKLHEACVQLRREAGDRQVEGAEVAVAATGAGPMAGCMLLTR